MLNRDRSSTLIKYGSLLLLAVLSVLFLIDVIGWVKYSPVAAMLFLTFAVTFLGIETVTKISFKGASIERDVTAAKEIRQDIRDLAKTIVEVVHGINATSITFSRARRATEQLEERLAALETLAEPDAATREQWRTDMAEQFSEQDVEDI